MNFIKSNAKKLLVMMLALILALGLVGCGGETSELKEELESAVNGIVVDRSINTLASSFELPTKANGEYDITWSIEENDYAELSTDRKGAPIISVSRPEASEGYQKFVITAKIEKDGESAERSWEGFVKPLSEGIEFLTAAEVKAAEVNTQLAITGVVTVVCKSAGFWVADETGAAYVYGSFGDVLVGDTVTVTGSKTIYYSLTEVINPGIVVDKFGDGTYPYEDNAEVLTTDDIVAFSSTDQSKYGKLVKLSGHVVDDPNGSYTYGIKDYKTGTTVTIYDSNTNADALATLKEKYDSKQFVELVVLVYDYHSNGYWRCVAINSTIKDAAVPTVSDEEKVATTKEQLIASLEGTDIFASIELATSNDFEGLTITWASDKPEVLSAAGVVGTSEAIENEVKLTATIKAGSVEETVELNVKVFMLSKSSVASALATCDEGGTDIWVEGKIVALDVDGYFYLADETGVIYVRTRLADTASVGDSVKLIGKTTYYNNSNRQYTRQMTASSIEKLDTEVEVMTAVPVTISNLVTPESADGTLTENGFASIMNHSGYGKIVEIIGYVQTRGSYGNVYICESADAESNAVVYYYKSIDQDGMKALVGKLVKLTCVLYDASASDGWRVGSYLTIEEITEGNVDVVPTAGAITIKEAVALATDADLTVEGRVIYVSTSNGIIIEDKDGDRIFAYRATGASVGDWVSISGKKGEYNQAPQIASPVVTVKSAGSYTYVYEETTYDALNAMSYEDKTIFGKVFKIKGTLTSGRYINLANGDVTNNLYSDDTNRAILEKLGAVEVELLVVVYQWNSNASTYNLFPIASTATVVTGE